VIVEQNPCHVSASNNRSLRRVWASAALETAVASGLAPLIQRGEESLDVRNGHETEVMAGWSPTGR
jgi:hypothetical protein